MLLYWLCSKIGVDIEAELAHILRLIANVLGKSKNFEPTGSEILNSYEINERLGYSRLSTEPILSFCELTEEEMKEITKRTYTVKPGHSVLSDIEDILDQLSMLAPAENREVFDLAKESIYAKAPETAKHPAQPTDTSRKPPENPNPTPSALKPPKPTKESEQLLPKMSNLPRSYAEAIRLSAEKKIPIYFYQEIDKKKIKAGIYFGCRIRVSPVRKISDKAVFIDCVII